MQLSNLLIFLISDLFLKKYLVEAPRQEYLIIASLPIQQLQGQLAALFFHEQSGI